MRPQSRPANSAAHLGREERSLVLRTAAAVAAWTIADYLDTCCWCGDGLTQAIHDTDSNCAIYGGGGEARRSLRQGTGVGLGTTASVAHGLEQLVSRVRRLVAEVKLELMNEEATVSDMRAMEQKNVNSARPARTGSRTDLVWRCSKRELMSQQENRGKVKHTSHPVLGGNGKSQVFAKKGCSRLDQFGCAENPPCGPGFLAGLCGAAALRRGSATNRPGLASGPAAAGLFAPARDLRTNGQEEGCRRAHKDKSAPLTKDLRIHRNLC